MCIPVYYGAHQTRILRLDSTVEWGWKKGAGRPAILQEQPLAVEFETGGSRLQPILS